MSIDKSDVIFVLEGLVGDIDSGVMLDELGDFTCVYCLAGGKSKNSVEHEDHCPISMGRELLGALREES